ncbi:hypothetical protein B4Q13_15715, partial [Lacticaseibacillus rhamnosus]
MGIDAHARRVGVGEVGIDAHLTSLALGRASDARHDLVTYLQLRPEADDRQEVDVAAPGAALALAEMDARGLIEPCEKGLRLKD